jgi:hypothetical protein
MKTLMKFAVIVLFASFVSLTAQEKDYSKYPGYVEFGDLKDFQSNERVTEVFLSENILNMVSKMTNENEPEVSELIGGLKLIKVHAFDVTDENKDKLLARVEEINQKVSGQNWERIVRVRDNSENVNVYIKTDGSEQIVGLLVMSVEPNSEAAFVNIVGNINLATIGKLGGKFNIPSLDSVKEQDSMQN